MRREAGVVRRWWALRWLVSFSVLVAFLVLHLASCSLAVDQSQSPGQQPGVHATLDGHSLHGHGSSDCDHRQHEGAEGESWVAFPRHSDSWAAAGLVALPAVLVLQPAVRADARAGLAGYRNDRGRGERRAGRHLLISVGVARI